MSYVPVNMLPTSYLNLLLFARKMLDKNGLWACKNFGSGQKSSAPGDYDSATICLRVVGRVADPVRVWPDPGPTWEKWKLDQNIRYIKIKFSKRPFCEIFTPLFFFAQQSELDPRFLNDMIKYCRIWLRSRRSLIL